MGHSKGTWKLGNNNGDVITDCGDGFPHESGHTATDYYGGFLIAESILKPADAQLIAASPELLEALQIVIGDIDKGPHNFTKEEKTKIARAAINKALGK
jgi:hypothetical protein